MSSTLEEKRYNSWKKKSHVERVIVIFMWNVGRQIFVTRTITPSELNGKRQGSDKCRWGGEQDHSSPANTTKVASRFRHLACVCQPGRHRHIEIDKELLLFPFEDRVHRRLHSRVRQHFYPLPDEQAHLPANPGRHKLQGRDSSNAPRRLSEPVPRPAPAAPSKVNKLLDHVRLAARVLPAAAASDREQPERAPARHERESTALLSDIYLGGDGRPDRGDTHAPGANPVDSTNAAVPLAFQTHVARVRRDHQGARALWAVSGPERDMSPQQPIQRGVLHVEDTDQGAPAAR